MENMGESTGQAPNPQNKEDIVKYLLDRISNLENRNIQLREQIRQLETGKRYVDSQKKRYERDIRKLKRKSKKKFLPPNLIQESFYKNF